MRIEHPVIGRSRLRDVVLPPAVPAFSPERIHLNPTACPGLRCLPGSKLTYLLRSEVGRDLEVVDQTCSIPEFFLSVLRYLPDLGGLSAAIERSLRPFLVGITRTRRPRMRTDFLPVVVVKILVPERRGSPMQAVDI